MSYKYTSYDSWKTENPWDGQARMNGQPFYTEPEIHDEYECPECAENGKYSFIVTTDKQVICRLCRHSAPEEEFFNNKNENQ